ncbi:MAG: hypothetical protein ACRD3S_01225, partial [Terracidiphilus sp.]
VGHHWVSYSSNASEHYLPEIALMFVHIPWTARWRAMERRHHRGEAPVLPLMLAHYGVKQLLASGWKEIHEASYQIITPAKTAELIISKHPDIASLKPDIAGHISQIIENVIQYNGANLTEYLNENPQSWYTKDWAMQASNDNPPKVGYARPSPDQGIDWPPAPDGLPGIPTYDLSDALIGTDANPGYAASAVATVLRMVANDSALNGQKWTAQAGTATKTQSVAGSNTALQSSAGIAAATTSGAGWSLSMLTSQYGLDVDGTSLTAGDNSISFNAKNWANRGLGVYVQYFDDAGNCILNPSNWTDVYKDWNTSDGKKYFDTMGSGNVIMGIPVWNDYETITIPFPPEAAKADVLFGGLGVGNFDSEIDPLGMSYTIIANYGIPAFLLAASVGLQNSQWYIDWINKYKVEVIIAALPALMTLDYVGIQFLPPSEVLTSTAGFVAGVIFSQALTALATKITGYVSTQEIMQNAPFVGWGLKIASLAAGAAGMIATTVEVAMSPATYVVEIKRSMQVSVTVNPDPIHGIAPQKPIWPDVGVSYELVLLYKGGTSYTLKGDLPTQRDQAITGTFPQVPSAPSDAVQVTANIYSSSGWLAGRWTSAWTPAVPPDGQSQLTFTGSIIEVLVPLTASTQYSP